MKQKFQDGSSQVQVIACSHGVDKNATLDTKIKHYFLDMEIQQK